MIPNIISSVINTSTDSVLNCQDHRQIVLRIRRIAVCSWLTYLFESDNFYIVCTSIQGICVIEKSWQDMTNVCLHSGGHPTLQLGGHTNYCTIRQKARPAQRCAQHDKAAAGSPGLPWSQVWIHPSTTINTSSTEKIGGRIILAIDVNRRAKQIAR